MHAVAIDLETTGLNPHDNTILCLSFCSDTERGVLPWNKAAEAKFLSLVSGYDELVFHNAPFDLSFLISRMGKQSWTVEALDKIRCTKLMARRWYMANSPEVKECSLREVARDLIGVEMEKETRLDFLQFNSWEQANKHHIDYAQADTVVTLEVYKKLVEMLGIGASFSVDNRACMAIAEMQATGMYIDTAMADKVRSMYSENEQEVYDNACRGLRACRVRNADGELYFCNPTNPFDKLNLASPVQVVKYLQRINRRVTASDNATLVEIFGEDFPLLVWRQRQKMIQMLNTDTVQFMSKDGRVRPTFNLLGASTGRMSSSKPNFQNIPAREKDFRKIFTAGESRVLVISDYSGMELRVLADVSEDADMCTILNNGADVHHEVAVSIYGEERAKEMRSLVKRGVFSTIYGAKSETVGALMGVDGKEFQEGLLRRFHGMKTLKSRLEKDWKRTKKETGIGRVTLKTGRMIPCGSPHALLNYCVQGTSAEITKTALEYSYEALSALVESARFVNVVHDEIIVECSGYEAEEVKRIMSDSMMAAGRAICSSVTMPVSQEISREWVKA